MFYDRKLKEIIPKKDVTKLTLNEQFVNYFYDFNHVEISPIGNTVVAFIGVLHQQNSLFEVYAL